MGGGDLDPPGPSPWIRHCTQAWNRIWLSSELRKSKNVFFISMPNEKERKRNMRIRNAF